MVEGGTSRWLGCPRVVESAVVGEGGQPDLWEAARELHDLRVRSIAPRRLARGSLEALVAHVEAVDDGSRVAPAKVVPQGVVAVAAGDVRLQQRPNAAPPSVATEDYHRAALDEVGPPTGGCGAVLAEGDLVVHLAHVGWLRHVDRVVVHHLLVFRWFEAVAERHVVVQDPYKRVRRHDVRVQESFDEPPLHLAQCAHADYVVIPFKLVPRGQVVVEQYERVSLESEHIQGRLYELLRPLTDCNSDDTSPRDCGFSRTGESRKPFVVRCHTRAVRLEWVVCRSHTEGLSEHFRRDVYAEHV
mmetsp:Transcript_17588/g.30286  ORF Transcript_17588/g.30286 Transcript_17588/m.30286 type:complete len:301 (+) Transcript_17588:285-1187(+)